MPQVGSRLSNRNSMFVSGSLIPAIDMDESEELHRLATQQTRSYQAGYDSMLDKSARRASRYLYDVPSGLPSGSVQRTLSKAFGWPQRIGQGTFRRSNRTSSSIVDQHKIYDIYEESIWHNSRTPHAAPGPAASAPFGLDTIGAVNQLHAIAEECEYQKPSTIGGYTASRLKSLHSIASSGSPWRMVRSIRLGGTRRDKCNSEWDGSSTFTTSTYSDASSDSGVSFTDMKPQARQPAEPKVVRKQSMLHGFAKRAGL
ncbi:hypothetical protein EV174_006313, partial [Coemansia sp. RSA 2320]